MEDRRERKKNLSPLADRAKTELKPSLTKLAAELNAVNGGGEVEKPSVNGHVAIPKKLQRRNTSSQST